tara:strand:- start:599 stop:916 length:318 start_codon:yes stop_codon:yes gene_type:complete
LLKKAAILVVFIYLGVEYGQNLLEFGSEERKNFYFIGMSLTQLLTSFLLLKAFKSVAIHFFFFVCVGSFINELYFHGSINYIEIYLGCFGLVYILTKKIIKKWMK